MLRVFSFETLLYLLVLKTGENEAKLLSILEE